MLIVDAMDPAGRSLALQQGAVLPPRAGAEFAGKPGLIYAKQHLGGAARPLPFWRTAETLLDTRLAPEEPDTQRFAFAQEASTVRLQLIYRRFWDEVAQQRGWRDNTLTVLDTTVPVLDGK